MLEEGRVAPAFDFLQLTKRQRIPVAQQIVLLLCDRVGCQSFNLIAFSAGVEQTLVRGRNAEMEEQDCQDDEEADPEVLIRV